MTLTLFYNANTGGAAIANVILDNASTTKVYPDNSFGTWTHVVQFSSGSTKTKQKLLFFSRNTGEAVIGDLNADGFTATDAFRPGSFDTWTHIAAVGPLLFFYDRYSGAAAVASAEPEKVKIDPQMLADVNTKSMLLTQPSGAGSEIGQVLSGKQPAGPTWPPAGTPVAAAPAAAAHKDFVTITSFKPGEFGTWTHVVPCDSYLFFYNQDSGAASAGKLSKEPLLLVMGDKAAYSRIKDYGDMGRWTHIASDPPYLLFYNREDGSAKIGEISDAGLIMVKKYEPGSFGDWTHLISQEKPFTDLGKIDTGGGYLGKLALQEGFRVKGAIMFYNAETGAGALGTLADDDLQVTKGFEAGAFGTWTDISGPSAAVDEADFGFRYRLFRTRTGVRIMNFDGTFTDVDVMSANLTPEQQQRVIDLTYGKMEEFIRRNANAIASGDIRAEDLGGELYGVASTAIVAIFTPITGLPLLDELLTKPFVELSKNAGRFYGAMVDELARTLKAIFGSGEGAPTVSQILGTLATVHLMGKYVPGAAVLGTDAWTLTKEIGTEIGGAAEDALNTVGSVAGDALDLGADAAASAADFVKNLFSF